jgi:hypothetical protein
MEGVMLYEVGSRVRVKRGVKDWENKVGTVVTMFKHSINDISYNIQFDNPKNTFEEKYLFFSEDILLPHKDTPKWRI